MKVSWRNKQCPAPILQQFEPSRFTKSDKGVSYQSNTGFLALPDAASVLLSFVELSGSSVSKEELLRAIVDSIKESGASNKLEPGFFLTDLRKRLARIEKRTLQKFVIVGHLSVNSSMKAKATKRISGVQITLGADVSHFKPPISHSGDAVFKALPSSYSPIKITVKARSSDAAFSKCNRSLCLLLGIWNHALSYGQTRFSMGGRFAPIAGIVLAPVRTIYNPKGESLNCWSYDPDFVAYPIAFRRLDHWEKLQEVEKSARDRLRTHKHRELLKNAFTAYYTACSYHVPENVFLSLWTLLELLTGTDRGETVVHRTLFPISHKHYERCRWELKHLNYCRNRLVHLGETRPDTQRIVYQLKKYVDILLKWWMFEWGTLDDKEGIFRLLDSPRNSGGIRREMRILDLALDHAKKAGR